jgi:hypothetical protein
MPSHQSLDRDSSSLAGDGGRGHDRRWWLPAVPVRAVAYAACIWCLAFAGVSAWQVATSLLGHPDTRQRLAADATGLAIMGALVGVLKLIGAAVALAAVRVRPDRIAGGCGSSGWHCGAPLGCSRWTRLGTW